jgi:membrane dipeptidase
MRRARGQWALLIAAALLGLWPALAAVAAADAAADSARVERILTQTPFIDGHNDLPWEIRDRFGGDLSKVDLSVSTAGLPAPAGGPPLMTDIPRLRQGHVGAQFWSVWIPVEMKGPQAVQMTFEQIDLVKAMCARYPKDFGMAYTAADITRLHKAHRIACLIGVEGGHQINDSLAVLRAYYDAGARYLTLTHSSNTAWADSATVNP